MHQHEIGAEGVQRLESDLRTFSPAGIERVAWGWRRHADQTARLEAAERAALHAIEQAERGPAWEELRRTLWQLMEGRGALLPWKQEHGQPGHTAERPSSPPPWPSRPATGCPTSSTWPWCGRWPRRCRGCCPRPHPPRAAAERSRRS